MTHRLQLLERIYRLRIPLEAGTKRHYLELLTEVGVVRPSLLQALLEARNAVEYRDRKPPSKRRCREVADATWYFLRSTDSLVAYRHEDFRLAPSENGYLSDVYWMSIQITYGYRFKMEARGWIPAQLGSLAATPGWIRVNACDFGTRSERWANNPMHIDKQARDWWLKGGPSRRIPNCFDRF